MNQLPNCLNSIWFLLGELFSSVVWRLYTYRNFHENTCSQNTRYQLPPLVLIPYLCCVRLTQSVKILIDSMELESKRCESLFFVMVGTGFSCLDLLYFMQHELFFWRLFTNMIHCGPQSFFCQQYWYNMYTMCVLCCSGSPLLMSRKGQKSVAMFQYCSAILWLEQNFLAFWITGSSTFFKSSRVSLAEFYLSARKLKYLGKITRT